MTAEYWARLSDWHNAWLAADPVERERLRTWLAAAHPDLVTEADELAAESAKLDGFLETPAFVLAAPELAKDPLLAADTMLGPYRIVGFLARGGTGDVYRATDVRLHRDVALKVLAPDTRGVDPQRVERFLQEARLTASLDHPNIVRVHDVGLFLGRPYFVAELLDGETLRARIGRGALTIEEGLRIGADVARGLVAAHAAGSVHRDLKPENIFLTRQGATKILDFGIAKLAIDDAARDGFSTLTGVVLGTAGYLAPEQIRGAEVDGRADLFALGAILFEMLTGQRAFACEHTVDTLHAILHDTPPDVLEQRRDVPPALSAAVRRLLEKAPDARFQTAEDLVSALEGIGPRFDHGPRHGTSAPMQSRQVTIERGHRNTARTSLWVAVPLTLATLVAITGWLYRQAAAPAPSGLATTTVAVLPFRSLPDSADGQLLELGLADVVISRLNQLSDVRVLPLSATERLRSADPREAGRMLGADRVLIGTLQRERDRVRASVQLLSISEERAIWAGTFDADARSAFSIQDAVVARVLEEVAPQLSSKVRSLLVEPGTRNGDAYENYLRGRGHAAHITGPDLARAAESFRRAVTLDPDYADAWAALGAVDRRLTLAGEVEPTAAFTEAKRAATRALELVPEHAEALSVLGTIAFWYDWDYPRAEELLRRAVARQPNAAESHVSLAHLLSNLGRHDEALSEIGQARSLDQNLPIARSLEGQFLVMARRYDEALARLDATVETVPRFLQGHVMRAYALIALRRYDEAVRACDIAIEIEAAIPPSGLVGARVFPSALRAYALAKAGRRAEAGAALERIRRLEAETRVRPFHVALVLHGLGRDGEALHELSRAVDGRDPAATFLGVDPKWDGLRASPSFQALMPRVNLLDVSNRTLSDLARSPR